MEDKKIIQDEIIIEPAIIRLYQFFDNKKIKPTALEKELKISNGYFGKQKKEKKTMGEGILSKILYKFPDLNPDWLLLNRGTMLRSSIENQSSFVVRFEELVCENERLKLEIKKIKNEKK